MDLILKLLGVGLDLWASKEKNKYLDKMLELKGEWNEENAKPIGSRDNVRLDRVERELRDLCEAFASAAGAART